MTSESIFSSRVSFSVELIWAVKPYFQGITTIPLTLSMPKETVLISAHLKVHNMHAGDSVTSRPMGRQHVTTLDYVMFRRSDERTQKFRDSEGTPAGQGPRAFLVYGILPHCH